MFSIQEVIALSYPHITVFGGVDASVPEQAGGACSVMVWPTASEPAELISIKPATWGRAGFLFGGDVLRCRCHC